MRRKTRLFALAERTGLIWDLTTYVLRTALQQCATWRSEGLDVPVAVNLSPRALGQSDLVSVVREALAEAGVPPSWLTLEITQSAFPDKFTGLLHVDEAIADRHEVLAEADRARALGLKGLYYSHDFSRHGYVRNLDHDAFRPFWDRIAK